MTVRYSTVGHHVCTVPRPKWPWGKLSPGKRYTCPICGAGWHVRMVVGRLEWFNVTPWLEPGEGDKW